MPRAKKPVIAKTETPDDAFHDEASKLVKTLAPLLKGQRHGVIVSAFALLMWDAGYSTGRQSTAIPIDDIGEEELDVPAAEVKPKKNQIN